MTAKAAKRPVIHDKKTLFFPPCSVSSHHGQNSHTHSVVTLVTSEEVSRRTNHWPRNCFVRVTRFPFDPVRRCVGVFWVATSQVLPVFPLSIRDWLPAAARSGYTSMPAPALIDGWATNFCPISWGSTVPVFFCAPSDLLVRKKSVLAFKKEKIRPVLC